MASIARIGIGAAGAGAGARPWADVAARALRAWQQAGVERRDAIVLVPYAALISPVRAAFAAHPGWQPRIETALTLAAALGPPETPRPGQCSSEPALDRLQAAQWLDGVSTDVDRAQAAVLLAETAAALAEAAARQPPARRAAWQQQMLSLLALAAPLAEGPGALEASLLQAAAAWSTLGAAPPTDRLFALEPAAWLVLRIGGPDPLAEAVLEHAPCDGWLFDLDPAVDQAFEPWVTVAQPRLICADDFESEALAASAEVLQALARSPGRVALVALDRALVRRVVALLLRSGVAVDDETGWKLSTSAAAGRVLSRLRAAAASAGGDERLDWLKRWPPALRQPAALRALEAAWRGGRNARLSPSERAGADALWAQAQASLDAWQGGYERSLADWLALLQQQLADDGEWPGLEADAAGLGLLQAMQAGSRSTAWQAALQGTRRDLAGFTAWFESLCETLTVQQPPRPESRVVLTPLARAVGRPFDHVVLAGADAQRLGRDAGGPALLTDGLAAALGLETADQRRQRVRLALAQLLRAPGLSILWRRLDGDAPVAPAAEVEWLQSTWQRAGLALPVHPARCAQRTVPACPVQRPQPQAAAAMPVALSASAVEALRQCPYRFFARSVLRLSEPDEIDQPARKRDYGDWLHATLHAFHSQRQPGQDDVEALQQASNHALQALGLDAAALLAYRASLARLLPDYLAWLRTHEAAGWQWSAGEDPLVAAPDDWAPQTLRGRIDRVDLGRDGVRLVIDYKTGMAQGLRDKLVDRSEDTQLPFYAALLQAQGAGGAIRAAYLALDEADGPRLLPHDDVEHSAEQLLTRLAGELQRLRDGASLPALGEGAVCETCEARGLCRRDHWPAEPPAAVEGVA